MRRHLAAVILGLVYLALCSQCSHGGSELISVVCGSGTPGAPGSSVVPVTVSMLNGTADYIDMTYSAVDFNGVTVQCNPASTRPRVSKSTPHTDNVVVTYSGTPTFPITITASGTGEAPNGDHEQTTEGLQSGNFGRGPHEHATEAPINNVNLVGERIVLHTVPVMISADDQNNLGGHTLKLKYEASIPNTAITFHCTPQIEDNVRVNYGYPVAHNVSVDVSSLQAPQTEANIRFTVTVLSGIAGSLSGTIPLNNSDHDDPAAVDHVKLYVDYSRRTVACRLNVTVDSQDRNLTLAYRGITEDHSSDVPCEPPRSAPLDPGHSDSVLLYIPKGHCVSFEAWGSAPGIAAWGKRLIDKEGNLLPASVAVCPQ